MSDNKNPDKKDVVKPDEQDANGVQPNPGIGQHIPNDKGQTKKAGNPAGQGNEGDDVMPAGRETPG